MSQYHYTCAICDHQEPNDGCGLGNLDYTECLLKCIDGHVFCVEHVIGKPDVDKFLIKNHEERDYLFGMLEPKHCPVCTKKGGNL